VGEEGRAVYNFAAKSPHERASSRVLQALQLVSHVLWPWMSVPKQHTRVAMPTEKRDFRNTQSGLEETTDGLVPKIVKPEIRQSNSAHDTPPSHLHRVFRRRKYPLVSGHSVSTGLQDGESAPLVPTG
jgi:hypothetical protein